MPSVRINIRGVLLRDFGFSTHPLRGNKAGLTGQTVPGRRIPGHWPYPGPEELAETEPVGPDAWTFLSLNYHPTSHPASALAA